MKYKNLFFIVSLFALAFSYSQSHKLVIKDSIAKKAIPLVSINYIGTNSGTFTDEKGYVEIEGDIKKIRASCIGYYDKTVVLSQLDSVLYLIPKEEKLEEVVLFSDTDEKKGLKKMKSKQKVTFRTNAEGFLFARKFHLTERSKLLKIKADILNDLMKKNLLLKVYNVNENGMPGEQVLYTHYYSVIEPSQKYVDLDLSQENLVFEKGSVFIALVITSNIKEKTRLEFGVNASKELDSYYKPYYAIESAWAQLPDIRGKKFNNFNINILTQETE